MRVRERVREGGGKETGRERICRRKEGREKMWWRMWEGEGEMLKREDKGEGEGEE